MYRHHSTEVKRKVIHLYQQGYSSCFIGNEFDIDDRLIRHWLNSYRHLGAQSFEKRRYTQAPASFKRMIVGEVLEKCLSCEQVAINNGVSLSAVKSWVVKVRTAGFASLSITHPRGRPPKPMGRPKKREPQTELEKLRYEVEYLRTENALLKKVRALVEERIARESGKKPKPSKN